MRCEGGWGGHNQCGIPLVKLVFQTSEVIFLIFEELIFLEKMISKEFDQQNMRKLEHTLSVKSFTG